MKRLITISVAGLLACSLMAAEKTATLEDVKEKLQEMDEAEAQEAQSDELTIEQQLDVARTQIRLLQSQVQSLQAEVQDLPVRCQAMVADRDYKVKLAGLRGDRAPDCILDDQQKWSCPSPVVNGPGGPPGETEAPRPEAPAGGPDPPDPGEQ